MITVIRIAEFHLNDFELNFSLDYFSIDSIESLYDEDIIFDLKMYLFSVKKGIILNKKSIILGQQRLLFKVKLKTSF